MYTTIHIHVSITFAMVGNKIDLRREVDAKIAQGKVCALEMNVHNITISSNIKVLFPL